MGLTPDEWRSQIILALDSEDLLTDPPDDLVGVEHVIALVKSRDSAGEAVWSLRRSSKMESEEYLGVLIGQVDMVRSMLREDWLAEER